MNNGKRTTEVLSHFNCSACARRWSIGDAPEENDIWYCPWCGEKQYCKVDKSAT